MKVEIVKYGKPNFPEIRKLVELYASRLAPMTRIESVELKDVAPKPASKSSTKEKAPEQPPGEILIALDERGREWSSPELARRFQAWRDDPRVKTVRLVIGGPYGLPAGTRERAAHVWSLSQATFPSDIAWLLVWEQVFRAFSILNKTGYHHE
jgi:23S rRNA (pseudouridine1915-N3)-methyltransferase